MTPLWLNSLRAAVGEVRSTKRGAASASRQDRSIVGAIEQRSSDPKQRADSLTGDGGSCPRPWKNASEEAAETLCFAGVRGETRVRPCGACGLIAAIRF